MIKYRIFWDQEFNFHFILDHNIYNKKKKLKYCQKATYYKGSNYLLCLDI